MSDDIRRNQSKQADSYQGATASSRIDRARLQLELRNLRHALPRLVKVEVVHGTCEGTSTVDCVETLLERGFTPVLADGIAYYCLPPDYRERMNEMLPHVSSLISQLEELPPEEQTV